MSALPDDILRSLAAFMPPSGLIVLVRCSHWLARVLREQLSRRLDDLFVITTQPEIQCELPFYDDLSIQTLPCELEALFGKATINETSFVSTYYFVEAPKGYDKLCRRIELYHLPMKFSRHYNLVARSSHGGDICFLTWLQRCLERLRAAEAQGEAFNTSVPSTT
jgi:hypothetical protein